MLAYCKRFFACSIYAHSGVLVRFRFSLFGIVLMEILVREHRC